MPSKPSKPSASRQDGHRAPVPVELLDGVGRGLPHVGRHVTGRLLDGQHHDGDDDGHPDAGQHAQRAGADQLVGVLAERGDQRGESSVRLHWGGEGGQRGGVVLRTPQLGSDGEERVGRGEGWSSVRLHSVQTGRRG